MKYVLGILTVIGIAASGIAGIMFGAWAMVQFFQLLDRYGPFQVFFITLLIACFCIFAVLLLDKNTEEEEEK